MSFASCQSYYITLISGQAPGNLHPAQIKICQALNIDINALANGKIEEPKTNDTTATASEKELLKNYRRLDKYGKTTVKSIINCEYKRVQEQSSQIQEKKHLSSHKNRILHNLYLNIALFVFITAF